MNKYDKTRKEKNIHIIPVLLRLLPVSLAVLGLVCLFRSSTFIQAFTYEAIEASITFECQKADGLDTNSYQIRIEAMDESCPVPEKDTIIIDDSGVGEFLINITEPGTYDYLLYQVEGSDSKIIYDRSEYEIHVFVTSDDNDKLIYSAAVAYAGSEFKPTEGAVFINMGREGRQRKIPDDTTEDPTTEEEPSGETTTEGTDSGEPDTGDSDPGKEDSGNKESGNKDSGKEESGNKDSGNKDSGNKDSGELTEESASEALVSTEDAGGTDTAGSDKPDKGSDKDIKTGDNTLIKSALIIALMSLMGVILAVKAKLKNKLAVMENDEERSDSNTGRG